MNITPELYDTWNLKKKELTSVERNILFKEGEIWWCSLGLNIGTEVYGKGMCFERPILILKKLTSINCIVLPITSRQKNGNWFMEIKILNQYRWIMLHQIRNESSQRFQRKITTLNERDFTQALIITPFRRI